MDGQKDIQKSDHLPKFLDEYVVRTNPFGRNASGERAYRRAERLVAAIHILTNHVPREEPSRAEARRASVELLAHLLALRDEMRVSVSPAFRAVQASLRELISLVKVLSIAGYVSYQNAGTVIEALDELGNFLTSSQRSTLSESVTFSKDDLLGIQDLSSGTSRKHAQRPPRTTLPAQEDAIKDKEGVDAALKAPDESVSSQDVHDMSNRRAQAVVEILKSHGTVGIKDISSNLPEYSEKMIQRQLAQLVQNGRVKKVGFKRWSRYTFIQ